jgi:hypothetical protein
MTTEKKPPHAALGLGIDEVIITIANNGYIVTNEFEDSPERVHVFGNWLDMSQWLFLNLMKPPKHPVT